MTRTNLWLGTLGLMVMSMFTQSIWAATCTSKASGNWNSATTWICSGAGTTPSAADDVILAPLWVVSLNNSNRTAASLTINAGATLDDDNQDLTINGNVVNNGTFGTSGGALVMRGASSTISGNGVFDDTDLQVDAIGISLPVGSTMSFTNGAEVAVGKDNPGTFALNGTISGTGLASGARILRVYENSSATINGTVNATNAYIRVEQNASLTNNGSVSVQYLDSDGNNPTSVWTQGANSSLTLSLTPNNRWRGTLNASAVGNTVTYTADVTPLTPSSNTYYNIVHPVCAKVSGFIILGSSPCGSVAPLAEYRMDEASWSGAANEVLDSSGNGNHAQSFNSANTTDGSRAIAGSPGTCRYGLFGNGVSITQGYVQTPLPNLTTDFTITSWIKTTNNTVSGQRILIDDQGSGAGTGYGLSLADGTTGRLRFYSRGITPVILDSTYTIANNTWYFVAAVADITNKKRTIYVYSQSGVLLNSTTEAAWTGGAWGTDSGPVSIGAETNASAETPASFHFRGNLDEVRVYQSALSQSALAAIATQSHACTVSALHHLEIQHASGTGLTCAGSTLTIRACADVACTTLYTGGLTGTLSATGTPVVNWVGGNGDFTIAAGSGSVTKDMQVASAGTVVFGITSPSPPPLNVTSCNFGSPVCTFTASLAGFIFSDTATGSGYTIPAQISGIATPTLYLRAVQASTANPAVCTPAIISSTTSVDMGYTCNNPVACQTGNLLGITNISTGATTSIAGSPNSNPTQNSTAVSLTFDANGSAPFTARYDDVGLITLNANKTITPFGGATPVTLSGSSNAYVVKPHRFLLSAIQCTTADAANCGAGALAMPTAGDNPAAASAAGVAFIRAGHPFSMTVTAVNSSGNATGNYGRESSPEGVSLTPNNAVAGMVAAPAINGAFGVFSAGAASGTAFTWGEVGIITLTPAVGDANYLGAGNVTGTTSGNVGRFYPEHFDTVITQVASVPMACPTGLSCPADYYGFVYSGQEFSVSVTARNAAGATTANYNTTTGFAKSTALSAFGVLGTTTAVSGAGTLGVTSVTAFAAGTLTDATQKYNFTAAETAPNNIYIRADDGEATSLRALNPTTTSVEGGVAVVSGRIKVSNAYGSELLPLQLSATAQYYNAGGWRTSTTDNLTNLTLAATYNLIKNASISGTTTASKTPVTGLSAGKLTINLTRPTGAATGIATITPVTPAYLPVIPGTATFGVYKGSHDVFIYQRESY